MNAALILVAIALIAACVIALFAWLLAQRRRTRDRRDELRLDKTAAPSSDDARRARKPRQP